MIAASAIQVRQEKMHPLLLLPGDVPAEGDHRRAARITNEKPHTNGTKSCRVYGVFILPGFLNQLYLLHQIVFFRQ
jgi:hypothetical protein